MTTCFWIYVGIFGHKCFFHDFGKNSKEQSVRLKVQQRRLENACLKDVSKGKIQSFVFDTYNSDLS